VKKVDVIIMVAMIGVADVPVNAHGEESEETCLCKCRLRY
jgi:hypothetical protein